MRRVPWVACMLVLLAAAPLAAAGATSHGAGALDIRGDWDAPAKVGATVYPQIWHIATENLSTGAYTGSIKGNPQYTIDGQVVGHTWKVVATYGSYVSHAQATINTSTTPWTASGTFHDTNGTTGTWTAKRLTGPPGGGSPTPAPANPNVCVGSCDGTNASYDATIDPGQSTETVVTSCSAGRATSAARRQADTGCAVDDAVTAGFEHAQALNAAVADLARETENLLGRLGSAEPNAQADLQGLQDSIRALGAMREAQDTQDAILQQEQQIDQSIRSTIDQLGDAGLQQLDSGLAADFGGDAATAAVRLPASAARTAVSTRLVLDSIAARRSTSSAAGAFRTALKLATTSSYSKARAQARLTLVLASLLGKQALAITLRRVPLVTIAHTHAHIAAHRKRTLTLAPSGDGARLLRELEVLGLRHKQTAQLRLAATVAGTTHRVTRTLVIR